MNEWGSKVKGVVDGHVHMGPIAQEPALLATCRATGIAKMALVCIQEEKTGDGLPQALYLKSRHPKDFYVFAGLDHSARMSGGRVSTPSLAVQVQDFAAMGCDGMKMIEGKPATRRQLGVLASDAYFAEYWECVQSVGLPVVWHVADPEEFWDPARIPAWAKARNWGYGPGEVTKEQLYAEVDQVLARYPRLKIVFAHFYFLSADLPRAARFLDAHPTVCFDLAPGVEMLYNISRNPDAGREFFTKYADRIVFGTDISSGPTEESRFRAGITFRWLESTDTFRVPVGADFLLGPPEDGIIRGMALPDEVLAKIYRGNFVRLAGAEPRPLNRSLAAAGCERLAATAAAFSGTPATETEASRIAQILTAQTPAAWRAAP